MISRFTQLNQNIAIGYWITYIFFFLSKMNRNYIILLIKIKLKYKTIVIIKKRIKKK